MSLDNEVFVKFFKLSESGTDSPCRRSALLECSRWGHILELHQLSIVHSLNPVTQDQIILWTSEDPSWSVQRAQCCHATQ